jgi:hypothetical protein
VVLALHVLSPLPSGDIVDYWPWPLGLMAYPVAAALILVAYGPVFFALLRNISSAGSFAPW